MSAARRVVEVGEGWGGWGRLLLSLAAACAATTCTSSRTSTNLPQPPARYEPAHDLGALFHDVQLSGIFEDSKTFADARPLRAPSEIVAGYAAARSSPQFKLRGFVAQHFEVPRPVGEGFRTYYLSRSQPPFFAAMVGLYARATDTAQALPYLDALEAEHSFWMDGADRLARGGGQAYRRVVRLSDGGPLLNRYWDDLIEPRPEAYRPDYEIAETLPEARRESFYRNVKATAESGWDFSSRWMRDPKDLRTLETTELIPVDLNSLLYHAERTIAALRAFRGRPGDADGARQFARAAEDRRQALLVAAYDPASGFFYDVRWRSGERVTDRPTLAAASPLYFGLATPEQGRAVAARLEREFLKPGGFVTTLIPSGQQWDAPNGWPPLEWLAIEGVRRYGRADLANTARDRWLVLDRRPYRLWSTRNVRNTSRARRGVATTTIFVTVS